MSIFDNEETRCNREGNKCRLRKKCARYLIPAQDGDWVANYWQEFGEFCEEQGHYKRKRDE